MRNCQKAELRQLAKEGYSFKEIRDMIDYACDGTIRQYVKQFNPKKQTKGGEE